MKRTSDGVCFPYNDDSVATPGGAFIEVTQAEAEAAGKRGRPDMPPPKPIPTITLPPMGATPAATPSVFDDPGQPVIDLASLTEPVYVEPPEAIPTTKDFGDMSKAELTAYAKEKHGIHFTAAETKVNMVKVLDEMRAGDASTGANQEV